MPSDHKKLTQQNLSRGREKIVLAGTNKRSSTNFECYEVPSRLRYFYFSLSLLHCREGLSRGKLINTNINERGFMVHRLLQNVLANMYVKCGCLLNHHKVLMNCLNEMFAHGQWWLHLMLNIGLARRQWLCFAKCSTQGLNLYQIRSCRTGYEDPWKHK